MSEEKWGNAGNENDNGQACALNHMLYSQMCAVAEAGWGPSHLGLMGARVGSTAGAITGSMLAAAGARAKNLGPLHPVWDVDIVIVRLNACPRRFYLKIRNECWISSRAF